MIIPNLEIVYPSNIKLAPPGWRPQVNIICIHDLGGSPKSTWHHDESGKTWISDPDFLGGSQDSVRVWTYGYNSEPAPNMTPASIALHADDLLASMMSEYRKCLGGPTIFIAHGLGGTIVKKAAELYTCCPQYFIIKDLTAGIVFLDTVHHPTDSEGVLKAVNTTVTTSLTKHSIKPSADDIREFAEAVRKVNKAFVDQTMPGFLILNCVAKRPVKLTDDDGTSFKALVVPKGRGEIDSLNVRTVSVDCDHFELTKLSSPSSRSHVVLVENIEFMMKSISSNKKRAFFLMPSPTLPSTGNPRPPSPGPPRPGRPKPLPRPPNTPGPPQRDGKEESYNLWIRKKETENVKSHFDLFLTKLGTWNQAHLGYDIHPMPGTCSWIQSEPDFQNWIKSITAADLYVCGGAGCGKTYLAKSVANYLIGDRSRSSPGYDHSVLSFFCNMSATGNKRPPILEYFIKSLLRSSSWFQSLSSDFWLSQDDRNKLDLKSLFEILRQLMASPQLSFGPPKTTEVFLIVDGLQECDASYVQEFLQLVASFIDSPAPRISPPTGPIDPTQPFPRETVRFKFLFTHAPNEIMFLATSRAARINMTDANIMKDIATYVDKEAAAILSVSASAQPLPEIRTWIKSTSGSFFLFAKYSLHDAVATARDGEDYGYSITSRALPCPERLGQYYDHELLPLLQSIDNHNYVLSTLQIVIGAERFISREEVRDAIACLHDDPRLRSLNIQTVLWQRCSRLIRVDANLEFHVSHPSLRLHFASYISEEQQHANMAFLCLKYLSQPTFGRGCATPSSELSRQHPFYDYAAYMWDSHFHRSNGEGLKLLPQLGRFITSPCYDTWSSYISWHTATNQWVYGSPMYHALMSTTWIPPVIALTCANAGHLAHELVTTYSVAESGPKFWNHEITYSISKFVHKLTASRAMAKLFESRGPEPDYSVRDAAGHTPLMRAAMAREGLPYMIKFFLQRTQDVNERSFIHGDTALLLLCHSLQTDDDDFLAYMMSLLLDAGADPNVSGFQGKTCLLEACERNSPTMASMLLRAGARPDSANIAGITPLFEALMNSSEDMVELLLDYDADQSLEFPWPNQQTPLTAAIAERNFGLFCLLLHRVDDVNQLDGLGFAPIHLLTAPENISWLARLLERPDVDLELLSDGWEEDCTKPVRRTPLCFAIVHDNFRAAEMLLVAGASPCRHPEATDETPLYMAVKLARTTRNSKSSSSSNENEKHTDNTSNVDIVELLLEYQSPINTLSNKSKKYAKSPLTLAVWLQDQNMVELLLRHGADPTLEEAYGFPGPLDAAIDDDEEVGLRLVRTLLDSPLPPNINYVPANDDGVDHILIETSGKRAELVQLLLDYGADTKCFLSPSSSCNTTPLLGAVKENNIDTCKVLIRHEPGLVNHQSKDGLVYETPLHMAAREGNSEMARILLEAGARPDLPSHHWHETPLWSACYRGHLEIAQSLYQMAPETLDTPSYDGETPLMVACAAGNLALVGFLLERGAEIDARCSMGRSCVCSAVSADDGAAHRIVGLLLRHGLGVDDVVSAVGTTVLGEACRVGDAQTVRMLLDKGADPAKGQKPPGNSTSDNTLWRSALRIAVINGRASIVDILLRHPQLASFVDSADYYRENALHMGSLIARAARSEVATMIYTACQRLEFETGIDHFQNMLAARNLEGQTPVDIALGRLHERPSGEALANTNETIRQFVTELTETDVRTVVRHKHLMRDLSVLLLRRRGYDRQAVRLLQTLTIDVDIKEEDGHFVEGTTCVLSCDGCEEDEQEVMSFCRSCRTVLCQRCVAENGRDHEMVPVPVMKDRTATDFNSEEIREVFDVLKRDFVTRKNPLLEDEAPVVPFEVDPESEDTTLSLASLHAFGYLVFRRRAWGPYLPLAPAVYERIRPWEAVIEGTRREFQEWVWETETSPFRLHGELGYFLEAGRRTAYNDLETVLREQVVSDVAWMFSQKGRLEDDHRFSTRPGGPRRAKQLGYGDE
ncbi:Ankyrin-1 [Colletotrichum higginsianum]|uniref:Ankyrin-1 n=1 Tax=Colletotrichum higginsianum TaxID=80884 RepID=A0A4V4NAW0_9PEZI|nr:Ankyrin-1 [Colletotrichum higginsianum]